MLPLAKILAWLILYRYYILLPIAIIEGPIITVLAGFLSSTGHFNFYAAYAIVVIGDILGDALYYAVGKYGRKPLLERYGHYVGLTMERLHTVDRYFLKHPRKTLVFGKLTHTFGAIVLVSAGIAETPFWDFLLTNLLATLPKSLVLLLVGYYFGQAYDRISHYIDYSAYIMIAAAVVLVALYIFITRVIKKTYFK